MQGANCLDIYDAQLMDDPSIPGSILQKKTLSPEDTLHGNGSILSVDRSFVRYGYPRYTFLFQSYLVKYLMLIWRIIYVVQVHNIKK